jgi:hypothetical protein
MFCRRLQHKRVVPPVVWAARGLGVACVLLASFAGPVYSDFPPLIDLAVDDADALIMGATLLAYTATSMCTGDINGDGFLDPVVAACNATPLGGARQGETFIIWGPALGDSGTIDLAIEQNQVSRIFGQPGDDAVYCQLACGNFNRNGRDDYGKQLPSGVYFYRVEAASLSQTRKFVLTR